jgi:hypothetical protein
LSAPFINLVCQIAAEGVLSFHKTAFFVILRQTGRLASGMHCVLIGIRSSGFLTIFSKHRASQKVFARPQHLKIEKKVPMIQVITQYQNYFLMMLSLIGGIAACVLFI